MFGSAWMAEDSALPPEPGEMFGARPDYLDLLPPFSIDEGRPSFIHCCGTGAIYSSSGSDLGKVPIPDPDYIYHCFSNKKCCTKSCLFNVCCSIVVLKFG
jgi:hypothetical protein